MLTDYAFSRLSNDARKDRFIDMVNEIGVSEDSGPIEIMGYTFDPAKILEECDPVAFNQEYLNYTNDQLSEEFGTEYADETIADWVRMHGSKHDALAAIEAVLYVRGLYNVDWYSFPKHAHAEWDHTDDYADMRQLTAFCDYGSGGIETTLQTWAAILRRYVSFVAVLERAA